MADIRPLHPPHASDVVALAQAAYPGGFHLSLQEVRDTLASLTPAESLCLGIFHDGRLTGYLMCWVDNSQIEGREQEAVILVDDIVVQGESRSLLFRLLRALRQGIVERGLTRLALEGVHRRQAEELFNAHPGFIARLGYELEACSRYYGEREGEELCWVRYAPKDA